MGSSESRPELPAVPTVDELARRKNDTSLQRRSSEDGYVLIQEKGRIPAPLNWKPTSVSIASVAEWQKELLSKPKNQLALRALASNSAMNVLINREDIIEDQQLFNIRIPHEGAPVTNQRASGRCWLFAATNIFRVPLMQKYKLDKLELSQAYLFYWDKLEKANYFLENILDTADEPTGSRLVQALLASPVSDGGQWDMVVNLVEKYGLVPQTLYPDSFNAQRSSIMDMIITSKLREDAMRLREMVATGSDAQTVSKMKDHMMQEIHGIVTLALGPPPNPREEFTWTFYDKDGKYRKVTRTPQSFAHELREPAFVARAMGGTDVHRLFSLVNDPRNSYLTLLTVNRLGNVWGGRPVTYVNVDMATLKQACIAMLRKGFPIFFGSDVGKQSDTATGIMDASLYDYDLGFNIKLGLSKAERLMTCESQMTHAMVLTAVHVEDGKPVRWRVENSWSADAGDKGYFVMTDAWMDEYVYQAVVDPAFVGDKVRDVLKQSPAVLDLWDPMGALAQ